MGTHGQLFWWAHQSTNNHDTAILFFRQLVTHLKAENPNNLERGVFPLDSARYHHRKELLDFIEEADIKVMLLVFYTRDLTLNKNLSGYLKAGHLTVNVKEKRYVKNPK